MKKWISFFLALCMLTVPFCAWAQAAAGTYTYAFDGMMGKETAAITLSDDGAATFSLPGNKMITDVYVGVWSTTKDGLVSIKGFHNKDAKSEHPVPGLWDWIDATTGDAVIQLDTANGTFIPASIESADSAVSGQSAMPADNTTAMQANGKILADIAYAGNSSAQKLDLMLPEGEGPHPLLIVVHGGGFAMGDKQMPIMQNMFSMTGYGFAVATVNYRLSKEAVYPGAIADVKAAVRYLRANAAAYNLNPERFAIWGESAGAYLAVMTAVTGDDVLTGDVTDNAGVSSSVKALADFYGPMTFFQMDEDFATLGVAGSVNTDASFESQFMGQNIATLDEATKTEMSPLTHITAQTALKVWIQAGTADANVPCTQSTRLADAFIANIGEANVHYALIEGAGHMDDAFYTADNLSALAAFLQDALQ